MKQFTTLHTEQFGHVLVVTLSRPKKLNAMNSVFWREMTECFADIKVNATIRAAVIKGSGKVFTAGLDLSDLDMVIKIINCLKMVMQVPLPNADQARASLPFMNEVKIMQGAFNAIETCDKPVIAAVHSACIGAGVDLITACDIRLCERSAYFSFREVDIGLCADLGTLQRQVSI